MSEQISAIRANLVKAQQAMKIASGVQVTTPEVSKPVALVPNAQDFSFQVTKEMTRTDPKTEWFFRTSKFSLRTITPELVKVAFEAGTYVTSDAKVAAYLTANKKPFALTEIIEPGK